jgi:hypothetical protein
MIGFINVAMDVILRIVSVMHETFTTDLSKHPLLGHNLSRKPPSASQISRDLQFPTG